MIPVERKKFKEYIDSRLGLEMDDDGLIWNKKDYYWDNNKWVSYICNQWLGLDAIIMSIDAHGQSIYHNNILIQAMLRQARDIIMIALMAEADRREVEDNG